MDGNSQPAEPTETPGWMPLIAPYKLVRESGPIAWVMAACFSMLPAGYGFFLVTTFRDSGEDWYQPYWHLVLGGLIFGVLSLISSLVIHRFAHRLHYAGVIPLLHAALNVGVFLAYAYNYRATAACAVLGGISNCLGNFMQVTFAITLFYDLFVGVLIVVVARIEVLLRNRRSSR